MEKNQNLNMTIDDGEPFFCHEMSVNFNPMQVILDFKSITPRTDMRSKDRPVINVKHNVVMVDPFHAKRMLQLLNKVITDYESEFGTIEKPKAVAKAEKKMAKGQKSAKKDKKTVSSPSYFG